MGMKDKEEIMKFILDKGEMQMGEKERETLLENLNKEVQTIIQSKLVHPTTKRPFSFESIQAAMKSVNFTPKLNQPGKKQAVDIMKVLQKKYNMVRAEMLLQIKVDLTKEEDKTAFFEDLAKLNVNVKSNDTDSSAGIECSINPSKYRELSELVLRCNGTQNILEQASINKDIGLLEDAGFAMLELRTDFDKDEFEEIEQRNKAAKNKKIGKKDKNITKDGEIGQEEKPDVKNSKKRRVETSAEKLGKVNKVGKMGSLTKEQKEMDRESEKVGNHAPNKLKNKNKTHGKSKWNQDEPIDQTKKDETDNILAGLNEDEIKKIEDANAQYLAKKFKCSKCKWGSDSNDDFKDHYKCDWHKNNLKLLLNGSDILTEDQYKEMAIMMTLHTK